MIKKTMFPFPLAVMTAAVISSTLLVQEIRAEEKEKVPPMYAVHDYASEELQKRRTIEVGQACDAGFGTVLEGIVDEMERNKDAEVELANKLKEQFKDIMEKNKDKNLCQKSSWCDLGKCKKRGGAKGRSINKGGNGTEVTSSTPQAIKNPNPEHVAEDGNNEKGRSAAGAAPIDPEQNGSVQQNAITFSGITVLVCGVVYSLF